MNRSSKILFAAACAYAFTLTPAMVEVLPTAPMASKSFIDAQTKILLSALGRNVRPANSTLPGFATNPSIFSSGSTLDVSEMNVTTPGGSTPRTLAERASDAIWAKDFGVACNGVLDDAPALQALIVAKPGRIIRLPSGQCNINSPITINTDGTTLQGEGFRTTLIYVNFTPAVGSAAVKFAPPNPTAGAMIKNGAIRDMGFLASGSPANAGAALMVQMPNYFFLDNVDIRNFFLGIDLIGGYEFHGKSFHVSGGFNYSSIQAGSRYMRIRSQPLASGGAMVPQGVYITDASMSGPGTLGTIEHGVELLGFDGVYLANTYIGQAASYDIYNIAENNKVQLTTLNLTGCYLDSSGNTLGGMRVDFSPSNPSVPYQDFNLVGGQIANQKDFGINLNNKSIYGFSAVGVHFSNIPGIAIAINGIGTGTIVGNTFSGVKLAAMTMTAPTSVAQSLAVSGNVQRNGGTYGFRQIGADKVTGAFSIVGNAWGSTPNPVSWDGLPASLEQFANSSSRVTAIPNVTRSPIALTADGKAIISWDNESGKFVMTYNGIRLFSVDAATGNAVFKGSVMQSGTP